MEDHCPGCLLHLGGLSRRNSVRIRNRLLLSHPGRFPSRPPTCQLHRVVGLQPVHLPGLGWAHCPCWGRLWQHSQLPRRGIDGLRDGTGRHVFAVRVWLALDRRLLFHLPRRVVVSSVVQNIAVTRSTPHWCGGRMGCWSRTGKCMATAVHVHVHVQFMAVHIHVWVYIKLVVYIDMVVAKFH